MTKPTQAQIEAAALALYRNAGAPTETLARAALTAAAEVGETKARLVKRRDVKFATKVVDAVEREKTNATIERCAQVAEQWKYEEYPTCKSIAAAIRALKEKA